MSTLTDSSKCSLLHRRSFLGLALIVEGHFGLHPCVHRHTCNSTVGDSIAPGLCDISTLDHGFNLSMKSWEFKKSKLSMCSWPDHCLVFHAKQSQTYDVRWRFYFAECFILLILILNWLTINLFGIFQPGSSQQQILRTKWSENKANKDNINTTDVCVYMILAQISIILIRSKELKTGYNAHTCFIYHFHLPTHFFSFTDIATHLKQLCIFRITF